MLNKQNSVYYEATLQDLISVLLTTLTCLMKNLALNILVLQTSTFFFKIFIYFILDRGKGGRKRGRETSMCGCLSCAPYWGPGLQPRYVALTENQTRDWLSSWHSIY